jgi:CMP-N-acetylneuraminic acid synthetase
MKILALIPARGGSKGVSGKNIKLLGNKPLLQYTYESAKASKLLTDIVIAKVARVIGLEVPFIRPESLARDTAASIDVIVHALETLEQQGRQYDIVCLLQPTNPFRPKGFIDKAIRRFTEAGTDSLISVLSVPDKYNPHWVFEADQNGHLFIATGEKVIIKQRQDLPFAYYRDGSIYLTKTCIIKEQHSIYGQSIAFIEADPHEHVNIDTMDDWKLAEKRLKLFH